MKVSKVLLVMFFLGVVACEGTIELGEGAVITDVSNTGVDGKADSLVVPSGAMSGAALYAQHCSSCHGADATGGASYPKSIVGFTPIETVVREGDGVMPPIAVNADEIVAIQSFLLGGGGGEDATQTVIDGSTPALQVYQVQCSGCHGAEGGGGTEGPGIRLGDPQLARFTIREGRNGPGNPSIMPTYDHGSITEPQLEEMVEWLDAFPNPTDGEGLYERYCANCHGMDGTGGPSFRAVAGILRAQNIMRSGHGAGRFADRNEYMPAYTAAQINDEEIVLIEQYMREL